MRLEMLISEMENIMSEYLITVTPKSGNDEGTYIEGIDAMHQFNKHIYEWLTKENLKPGKFIDIPDEYVDDPINKMNFSYRIMKKYKLGRKPYKNNYTMYGHNFYRTREKLMKAGFKLVDSFYNDEGNTTGSVLEKNGSKVGIHIPGLKPHPSMDDITIAFDEKLFDEIGRIFPYLWMKYSHQHPMFITESFRYCDLYNVD